MEPEDKISFNYTDGIDIHDDVYRKVIKDFNILYEREKMGGNRGVHLGIMEQDPSQWVGELPNGNITYQ
jgi:hypothetical protein